MFIEIGGAHKMGAGNNLVEKSYFINGYLLYPVLCSSSRKHSKKKAKRQSNSSSDEDSPQGALFTSYVMCHQCINIVT